MIVPLGRLSTLIRYMQKTYMTGAPYILREVRFLYSGPLKCMIWLHILRSHPDEVPGILYMLLPKAGLSHDQPKGIHPVEFGVGKV